ncbi:hypothetical protein [Chryseobacterium sp. JK1]|uniref:hypothetical protein n=1 Tax=Chryseobacterium sp. JK1 TaxID=874294 RepID=UPI003D68C92A
MGIRKKRFQKPVYFVAKIKMGYYRKGHFRRNGTWVSGHYVNTYGRNKRRNSSKGCSVIFWGGIISLIFYLL